MKRESQPLSIYSYDISLLEQTEIEVRFKKYSKKIRYSLPYERAIMMVEQGMAGIVHKRLIHRFYDYQTLRIMILERDRYTCQYCGEYGNTIDHIVPRSKGGISSFKNCVCACAECNVEKSNFGVEDFIRKSKRLKSKY